MMTVRQLATCVVMIIGVPLSGQLSERSTDPLGLSLRVPRVRVIHSDSALQLGTSMHLQQWDPWLAYALGHSYFEREWTKKDGLLHFAQERPLAEAATNSCAMCHNLPFRTAGTGGVVAVPGAHGRNIPHLFGIGLVEILGLQIRQQILGLYDTNHNGFLDVPDEVRGKHAIIEAAPGVSVDFGSLEDLDGDGWPSLNDVIQAIPVDRGGNPLRLRADGRLYSLLDHEVAGYDLAVGVISSSAVVDQQPTIRAFVVGVMRVIFGLPIRDPSLESDRRAGASYPLTAAWAGPSNAGALQLRFPLPGEYADPCHFVSEGEVDLLEWFLTNHPRPGVGPQTAQTRRGRYLLRQFNCTTCHIEDWVIQPKDPKTGMPGDLRFFDLEVSADNPRGQLEGRLKMLTRAETLPDGTASKVPNRDAFTMRGFYSDLLYHDLGDRFYEHRSLDGKIYVTRRFRTTPLWGSGSTAPYGHDGRSATLDDVIRRHRGEAADSSESYISASLADRSAVIAFLKSLVLYQTDFLPTDLNLDGTIDSNFEVAGHSVGPELFRPEFLFRSPPQYRGWITRPDNDRYFSYELLNAEKTYGHKLEALRDTTGTGIPDLDQCRPSLSGTTWPSKQ